MFLKCCHCVEALVRRAVLVDQGLLEGDAPVSQKSMVHAENDAVALGLEDLTSCGFLSWVTEWAVVDDID